jgi:hypothetical protein
MRGLVGRLVSRLGSTAAQAISSNRPANRPGFLLCVLWGSCSVREGHVRKSKKPRDQVLRELRNAYEGGASIRTLVESTGRSYGSIHSMLRESGTTMRSRGGPNHRTRLR